MLGWIFSFQPVEKDSFVPGDSITLYKSNEYGCQKEKKYRFYLFVFFQATFRYPTH